MAEPKISGFIISLIIVSLGAVVFANFFAGLNVNYTNPEYDNETFESLNKLAELTNQSNAIRSESENINAQSDNFDILGGLLNSAYTATKVAAQSIETFYDMSVGTLAEKTGIPLIGPFITAGIAILLIIIFVGVLISALVKRGL